MNEYQAMTSETIGDYVKKVGVFPSDHQLAAKEVGDGNLNLVFRISDLTDHKTVIVKQALPYLKVAGEGWKLTIDRNRIEAETMQLQNKLCSGSVPRVYHHSDDYALTIMEDLGEMETLRNGLMSMKKYPKFPGQIGRFFARNLFLSSDMGMGPMEKKKIVSRFISPELCDITEKLVLNDPYADSASNNVNPYIKTAVEQVWGNQQVRLETAKLKSIFMTKAEALLHGDVHTGSIFIDENKCVIFDAEFAFYGPYGYDIGLLLANFILNYVSWEGRADKNLSDIKSYREYLLKSIEEIWCAFSENFHELWQHESKDIITQIPGYEESYVQELLHETIGFSACEVMRRIIGMAHVPDLDAIEDLQARAKAQRLGLKIGQAILLQRNNLNSIQEFTDLIKQSAK
ncbi:5-methylthioribose kinase [Sporomusaceae bacterium BoRhaA]|uniref:S-methyl-5-thioribose kinase n=1 Tax=Pelorhabdus rhamnosifermentans TaxID=2772457 RepID=UPI001C061C2A|nr:S-methyl-5-thioribose kinase [Pelorhabdus rhamnosifermentans]MBU2699268.1 5-methylthioribose kinase [Pelorhabdus rhamnosifermentans]